MDEQNNPQLNTKNDIKTIHTYESDMADAVREQQASIIKIALAEQNKKSREQLLGTATKAKSKNIFFIIGGIILVAGAFVGAYLLMSGAKTASVVAPVQTNIQTFIPYDTSANIDITRSVGKEEIGKTITTEASKTGKPNSIKSIFLTKENDTGTAVIATQDFFTLINAQAPGALVRSLSSQYMLGTYQKDSASVPHLFIMFKTSDYSQTFSGMLAWERTLLDDLFTVFNVDVSGGKSTLFGTPWKDVIINNKDARVLSDESGKDVLYYLFIDKNTLLITDSKDAITETTNRLITANSKPL